MFDKPAFNWGWTIPFGILVALEYSGHMESFSAEKMEKLREQTIGIGNFMVDAVEIQNLVRHPIYLAVLIPLFFKFTRTEGYAFEVNFDGLKAVRAIDRVQNPGPLAVFLKWGEITEVKKILVGNREVLEIHDAKGPAAQLIWDIDTIKKKVMKKVLKGLVDVKHPLRAFLEKELP